MPETSEPKALVKVLVADDEKVIADSLAMSLTHAGYDARAVYSGEMAVEMALSFRPNMMICDVVMVAVSGIEAAIEVRAKLTSCEIFLVSGRAETWGLLERARNQGHNFELLLKPLHPAELLAKLAGSDALPNAGERLQAMGICRRNAATGRIPSQD